MALRIRQEKIVLGQHSLALLHSAFHVQRFNRCPGPNACVKDLYSSPCESPTDYPVAWIGYLASLVNNRYPLFTKKYPISRQVDRVMEMLFVSLKKGAGLPGSHIFLPVPIGFLL